jgi:hypothetical protein
MIKIYNKVKPNYKENKLIKELQPIIRKKLKENPSLANEFVPANNYEELKRLHNMYVSDEVEFEEINQEEKPMAEKNEELEEPISNNDSFYEDEEENTFIDPFNREEPIVRDYVTDGGMEEDTASSREPNRTQFDEPVSWSEAFELPSDEDGEDMATPQGKNSNQKQAKPKPEPKEPLNPHFDDMSSGKKRRSTKKFATYIVETVCMLAEKGFVWYANKDINESKLAEYEMTGEMNLSLLVTLEDGQEATVKQFFQGQTMRAEQLAKIDPEEKKDLAEVLAEVLLEKGIAPTSSQELILIGFKIFGAQAISLLSLKSQTNALLGQLREMNSGTAPMNYDDIPSQEPTYEAPTQEVSQPIAQPQEEITTDDDLIIEKVIETKE